MFVNFKTSVYLPSRKLDDFMCMPVEILTNKQKNRKNFKWIYYIKFVSFFNRTTEKKKAY